jgi:AraC family transcriptional regulator
VLLFQKVKSWDGIEVARYRFPPGERKVAPLPGHVLRLHRSGPHYFVQRLNGRTYENTETRRHVTIIPASRPFEQVFQVESDDLNVVVPGRVIYRAALDAGLNPDRVEIQGRFCVDDPQVHRLGLTLGAELEHDSFGEQLFVESLSYALAIHIIRSYSSLGEGLQAVAAQISGQRLSGPVLCRVIDYVNDSVSDRLTLAGMAAAANLSPFHFSRLFKASTGLTPYQYVIRCRTEAARDLLIGTDIPIREVALRAGFADQSHLSRHLRRRFGVTPGDLR